jgi:hypothetical protein
MASVRFGSPLSRTTRTASATSCPTASPVPSGVTENATSTPLSSQQEIQDQLSERPVVSLVVTPAALFLRPAIPSTSRFLTHSQRTRVLLPLTPRCRCVPAPARPRAPPCPPSSHAPVPLRASTGAPACAPRVLLPLTPRCPRCVPAPARPRAPPVSSFLSRPPCRRCVPAPARPRAPLVPLLPLVPRAPAAAPFPCPSPLALTYLKIVKSPGHIGMVGGVCGQACG